MTNNFDKKLHEKLSSEVAGKPRDALYVLIHKKPSKAAKLCIWHMSSLYISLNFYLLNIGWVAP